MANFVHYSNVNSLFKKKNEQVWRSRNQDKLASPTPVTTLVKPRRRFSVKVIVSAIILGLLIVGGVSAMVLSQMQQDVRQRASGCVYWNGQPAVEGSYDNRGGIRQQCVNGYWDRPDDGNLDPSQIVAAQNANKPKLGCVNWTGENVSHGAYDNRGGIRQQCNNGLWDVPDDGNLDPSGLPQPEREMRGCVNWAGQNVAHGAYDVRGDIRQQCLDGLWDTPDDRITDPNDTVSLAVVGVTNDLAAGDIEYTDARTVYDQYCRTNNIDPSDVERCQSLGRLLTQEEQMIRYSALEERVQSNTDQVSFAIGGLDDRSMDYAGASDVYQTYCQGANAQQTSGSVCQALRSELDEIEALRDRAQTANFTALNDRVTGNTNQVAEATSGLSSGEVDVQTARQTFQTYCTGAGAQQTSASACDSLEIALVETSTVVAIDAETQAGALAESAAVNDSVVSSALENANESATTLRNARNVYRDYCTGDEGLVTSDALCGELSDAINEGVAVVAETVEAEPEANQSFLGQSLNALGDYISNIFLPAVQTQVYEGQTNAVTDLYSTNIDGSCVCNGSYEGNAITENVGGSGTGNDGKCYACYPVSGGGCQFFSACGYDAVTIIDSSLESDLATLQLNNPNNLFLVDDLTSDGQVAIVSDTLALMPDNLVGDNNITYLIGNEGEGGGSSGGEIVYVGSPIGESYTQNPDLENGYGMSIVAHETLHSLDGTVVCEGNDCATYLEMFEEVAEESGLVFESEFSDMEVDDSFGDFLLYTEYPTTSTEGFAITGAAYMLAGEQLQFERPELYAFYRDVIFDGVEYVEVLNADCNSTRIEIRSEETERAQQSMEEQCN